MTGLDRSSVLQTLAALERAISVFPGDTAYEAAKPRTAAHACTKQPSKGKQTPPVCTLTMLSPEVLTEVRSSKLSALPNEILVQIVELSSLPDARAARAVSKGVCQAASFALTRGRWRPLAKLVHRFNSLPRDSEGIAQDLYPNEDDLPSDYEGGLTPEFADLIEKAWEVRDPNFLCVVVDSLGDKVWDLGNMLGAVLCCALPTFLLDDDDGLDVDDFELLVVCLMELQLSHGIGLHEVWSGGEENYSDFLRQDGLRQLFRAAERCGTLEVSPRVSECFLGGIFIAELIEVLVGYDHAAEFLTDATVQRMTANWANESKRTDLAAAFETRREERATREFNAANPLGPLG